MTAPQNEKSIEKLIAEGNQLREGILAVTLSWASLENALAAALEAILNDKKNPIGFAIYFAPNNSETRIEIVDHAIWAVFSRSELGAPIDYSWKWIKQKLDKLRRSRNKVIHGNITTVSIRNHKSQHVRLTPAIFDVRRSHGQRKKNQLPGISGHDVMKIASDIARMRENIAILDAMINAFHANDKTALHKKWNELEAHRQNYDGQIIGDRNPPKR